VIVLRAGKTRFKSCAIGRGSWASGNGGGIRGTLGKGECRSKTSKRKKIKLEI
jgi:hypothetical protein